MAKATSTDVYTDCLTKCGGVQHLHKLKLYHATGFLRAEITSTNENTQVATLAKLTDEGICPTDTSPLRALEARVLLRIIELGNTGFTLPPADLLRRIRGMFNVHCPNNNQLQIGYTAYHAACTDARPATGAGLLRHMAQLEKTTRAQGGELFDRTVHAQPQSANAAKEHVPVTKTDKVATKVPAGMAAYHGMLTDSSLTALQKKVLDQHLQAAMAAVKFAGAHPTETKLRPHFCPVHMFNETHGEADCNRCKSLKK